MKATTFAVGCLWVAFFLLRTADLATYPWLDVDEGLYTIQVKDAVLFNDARMNGSYPDTVVVDPAHFGMLWALFHFAPATIFSARAMNGLLGCLTLLVVWRLCKEQFGQEHAYWSVLILGLSFTMISLNRRAWLETGVTLISVVAIWCSTRSGRWAFSGLAASVAALLLYKMNAIYLVPSLLLPSRHEPFWRGVVSRAGAVVIGALAAAAVFFFIYKLDPDLFRTTYQFQFTSTDGEVALVGLGRFGLFPHMLTATARALVFGQTDLVALTALAFVGTALTWDRREPVTAKLLLWLLAGYTLLSIQFNHIPYYLPFIAPAAVLTVTALLRLQKESRSYQVYRGLVYLVVAFSVVRLAYSWHHAKTDNPPLEALRWIESHTPPDGTFTACAEVTAATERRGYILYYLRRSASQPDGADFASSLREKHVKSIVYDRWESQALLKSDAPLQAQLDSYATAVNSDDWTAYRVP
jgi:hypothetical protein